MIVRVHAVAARQAGACMRLYSFTVYIYLSAMHASQEKRRVNMDPFLHSIYTIRLYTV